MKTILASIDFSDVSTTVVEMAGALARAFQSKLYIMHVAEEVQPEATESGPGILSLVLARDHFFEKDWEKLEEWKRRFEQEGLQVIAVHERGAPAERILAEAEKLGPDVIVVGSHGHRAAYHLILGSVVQKLTRHAAWPLLIVPSLRTVNSPKAG